ncbi:hypothetical protein EST38_g11675 [Candolleomyces aberdarensis]|uniref:Cytochrome P450 n=1 Tax=Candolleomyces aberdarensis TaxID=2316362 RepID=A0A4Q2D7K9_9AGAR|nr:hypothetical protein EST38_g11675 [Candolleomyces aberdarensis]
MNLLGNDAAEYHEKLAREYGRVFKFTGLFKERMLYVSDPKALYYIFIKDVNSYDETTDFQMIVQKVFGMGLFSTQGKFSLELSLNPIDGPLGEHHRKQRKLLNPVFALAHLKGMVPTLYEVANKTRSALLLKVNQNAGEKEVEVGSWMTRTILEFTGQSGFGYSFDPLTEGSEEHPYATSLKGFIGAVNYPPVMAARLLLLPYSGFLSPKIQRAIIDFLPWKQMHRIRDMVDIMHNTSLDIFEATKRSANEGEGRKDIMSVLFKANNAASDQDRIPESELVAQVSTITFAAMDTTSNAMARILFILGQHPEVQEKLRAELRDAFKGQEELDHDTLASLPYLDAVVKESMRVYPPLPFISREATRDANLPLQKPVISEEGKPVDSVFVPKGSRLIISLLNCNTDPDIWGPDAREWKPERWLAPLPSSVQEARVPGVYSNLMTFSGGGRSCIGFKVSELEMKVLLSVLLQTFRFAPSDKKIIWEWNSVVQPTTEDAEITANGTKVLQLPLKVSLA